MSEREPAERARDLALRIEKTLASRRLYAPHMSPYKEAMAKFQQGAAEALAPDGLSLRVGAEDLAPQGS